ncbi:hypothetical protein [Nereida ignava]
MIPSRRVQTRPFGLGHEAPDQQFVALCVAPLGHMVWAFSLL